MTRLADRPTALVALREIREATRATSFRVTLILSAVALAAIIVIANLGRDDDVSQRIVVSGPDAAARAEASSSSARPWGSTSRWQRPPTTPRRQPPWPMATPTSPCPRTARRLTTEEELDLADGSDLSNLVNVVRAEPGPGERAARSRAERRRGGRRPGDAAAGRRGDRRRADR